MSNIFKYSITAILLVGLCSFTTLNEWALKKDKNGVQVYTRSRAGSQLKEYKAVTLINTTVEKAFAVLNEVETYPEWQNNCSKSYIVNRPHEDKAIVYVLTNAPWPASDRDVVIDNEVIRGEDGSITMKMTGIEGKVPVIDDAVRITYLDGFWKLTPKDGKVEVIQQVHADPGGRIPDWLANSVVEDSPYVTMLNMKKMLEK